MTDRKLIATMLAGITDSTVKRLVFGEFRESKKLRDQTLDQVYRGHGNRAIFRMGGNAADVIYGFLFCRCDSSPCEHEWKGEFHSQRTQLHRERRGKKTRRGTLHGPFPFPDVNHPDWDYCWMCKKFVKEDCPFWSAGPQIPQFPTCQDCIRAHRTMEVVNA